jgi:hypothetical protein
LSPEPELSVFSPTKEAPSFLGAMEEITLQLCEDSPDAYQPESDTGEDSLEYYRDDDGDSAISEEAMKKSKSAIENENMKLAPVSSQSSIWNCSLRSPVKRLLDNPSSSMSP